ncbi:MAG: hypothetical protein GY754_12915 [bacterium]|nr:hypothetical protein [bacterium]
MRKNKNLNIFYSVILFLFIPLLSLQAAENIKKVYVHDATPARVKKQLAGERILIKGLLEESINLNKKLEQVIVDDYKSIARKMGIQEQELNEDGALEVAENEFSDLFLAMALDKRPDGEYKLTLRLKNVKTRETLYTKTIDFDLLENAEPEIKEISQYMFEDRKLDSSLYLDIRLCYLHPINDFADIANPGLGLSLRFGVDNLFISYFTLALETAYYRFTYQENTDDTINHVPLFLVIGYRLQIFDILSITPVIGGGAELLITSHGTGKGFYQEENTQTISVQETIKTGVEFSLKISKSTSILLGASYTVLFEEKKLDFVDINLGMNIKL